MKKTILTSLVILASLSSATAFAGHNLSESEVLSVKINTCGELVRFARSEGIHSYDFMQCLRTTQITFVSEVYNPEPLAPVVLEINLNDNEIQELKSKEQWLSCTFEIQAPLIENKPQNLSCSIEG